MKQSILGLLIGHATHYMGFEHFLSQNDLLIDLPNLFMCSYRVFCVPS